MFLDKSPVSDVVTDTERSHLRWSYLSTGTTALMQLAAAATITRFLQPSDYGLAALATLCYTMTGYFTQLGIGRAIVQKPGLTSGNIRAGLSLSLLTGMAGFLILVVLSPMLGRYFREARLQPVIIVFGLSLIFQSMGATAAGLLRRELRLRALAISDFVAYLLSTFGIGLPMAMYGLGVWALVGSNLSQPLIAAVAYFIARPHPIKPTFKREDYIHFLGFSAKASLTTTIEALGGSMDMIVMGRVMSPLSIGLYNRSLTLSTQPTYNISMGLTRVFHPSIARAAERTREECCRMLVSSERQLMSFIIPVCVGAAISAPTIIPVVFGRQWTSAIPLYQVLCLVAVLDASFHLPSTQLEIFSLFRHKVILQICFGSCFGLGIFFLAPRKGVISVAVIYALLQALRTIGLHSLSARSLGVTTLFLMRSWSPGLVCGIVLAVILFVGQFVLSVITPSPSLQKLMMLILLSAATVFIVYRALYRNSVYKQWIALFQS